MNPPGDGGPRSLTTAGRPPTPHTGWAYFFDIDGTLLALADSPNGVRLDPGLQRLVEALYRSAGGAVALISGRSLEDVDRLFPGTRFPAAGQHGIERRDAGARISRHAFPDRELDWARQRLSQAAITHPGLLLEDKGLSLALHYRRAPWLAGYAHRLVRACGKRLGAQFCVQAGKRVVELKPTGKDKGIAVQEFMQEEPFRGRTPVFVGDDLTDEYGFATVNHLHGHSIKVGRGATAARWRLSDIEAVRAWLESGVS
jgi:trehalose 6-phosphate phosphatase